MNLCSDSHEEVCYEGRECPVCELIRSKDERIEELERKIAELETERDNHVCECNCGNGAS